MKTKRPTNQYRPVNSADLELLLSLVSVRQTKKAQAQLLKNHGICSYDIQVVNELRLGRITNKNIAPITPITTLLNRSIVDLDDVWAPGGIIRPKYLNCAGIKTLKGLHNIALYYNL